MFLGINITHVKPRCADAILKAMPVLPLVASQRIGFTDLIDSADSVHALQYKAS